MNFHRAYAFVLSALVLLSSELPAATDLLNDIFRGKQIDERKVEQKWGYLNRATLALNLDQKNWEGGDSATKYELTNLDSWTFEEKRLLTFLLFLNVQYTEREITAVGKMLGADARKITAQLSTISEPTLTVALARNAKSPFTEAMARNYFRNVALLAALNP